jgi:integrase
VAERKLPYGQGAVYEDKHGQWFATVNVNGRRRVMRARDERDANAKRVKALAAADAGLPDVRGSETVAQAAAKWLERTLPTRRLAPSTLTQYRSSAALIVEALGRVKVAKLRVGQVDSLLGDLAQAGYSRSSISHVRKVACQILADAKRRGTVATNVAIDSLKATGVDPREPRALSEKELTRFLDKAAGLHYEHLWTIALDSGLRRGELLGLRWSDVNERAGTMQVRQQLGAAKSGRMELTSRLKTKNSKRTVRISPAGVKALRAQKRKQAEWRLAAEEGDWVNSGLVFTTDGGTWIDPANHDRSFKLVLRLAGLDSAHVDEAITLHWFRHTHASHLVDNGVEPSQVAAQLGDSLETVLRTYYHSTRPADQMVSEVMGAIFDRVTS